MWLLSWIHVCVCDLAHTNVLLGHACIIQNFLGDLPPDPPSDVFATNTYLKLHCTQPICTYIIIVESNNLYEKLETSIKNIWPIIVITSTKNKKPGCQDFNIACYMVSKLHVEYFILLNFIIKNNLKSLIFIFNIGAILSYIVRVYFGDPGF